MNTAGKTRARQDGRVTSIRLDLMTGDYNRVARAAEAIGLSKAAFARMVVLSHLNTLEGPPPPRSTEPTPQPVAAAGRTEATTPKAKAFFDRMRHAASACGGDA